MHNVIFYYGAMKCGKTLLALSLAHQFQSQNKRVLVLKPAADTREGESLTSRAGLSISARIFENTTVDEVIQADVVIIDEVQFLDVDAIDMLFKISMRHNIKIVCFGLLTNFKTEMFPASKRLVELSATLIQIPTADNTKFINARFKNGIIQTEGAEIVCGDEEYHVLGLQEYWYLINQNL